MVSMLVSTFIFLYCYLLLNVHRPRSFICDGGLTVALTSWCARGKELTQTQDMFQTIYKRNLQRTQGLIFHNSGWINFN